MTGPLGSSAGSALSLGENPQLRVGCSASNASLVNGSIANFRLFSKALNAGQVQELYDYQKDYFLGSRSSVTLYKGHLGIGVAEPSGQLELAGDERLQEYPPRALTGYETLVEGHGVFCAIASSTHYSTDGWKAFPPNSSGVLYWASGYGLYSQTSGAAGGVYAGSQRLSATTELGEYLILELPYKIILSKVFISARSSHTFKAPSNFTIYGSNNNSDWYTLSTVTGATPSQSGGNYYPGGGDSGTSTSIGDTTPYKYLAIVVSKTAGGSDIGDGTNSPGSIDAMMIANISYFGTPGPTTLDKGSLTLGRSLDVPRISRYDVDTETPRPEKLVVDFDTTVNSSPTDISGQGNHGTFYNGASYSAADKAFNFDGTNDYIEGKRPTSLSGNVSYTIALWVKFDTIATNNYDGIFELGDRATNAGNGTFPSIFVYHGSNLGFYFSNGGAVVNSAVLPVTGRWYHLVAVYDQGANKGHFYIDGGTTFTGSGTPANTTNILSSARVVLGGDSTADSGQYLDGKISNFKLYNVALEPSEVRKLYNLGRTGRSMVISDTAVGIGKVPEAQLDVRGNIKCDGVVRPYTCAFAAYASSGGDSSTTGIFPADSVDFNIGNCYDTSTYKFIASVHGIYNMSWSAFTNTGATTTSRIFAYLNNGAVAQKGHTIEKHGNSLSLTVELEAGDTFHFGGTGSFPVYYYGAGGHNRFCGHLICAL